MKKTLISTGIVIVAITIAMIIFNKVFSSDNKEQVFTEVQQGLFEITVSNAGRLVAENSLDISGPDINEATQMNGGGGRGRRGGMMMRAMELTIQDIVPEGTMVQKGDYIAQLDRTEYSNTLNEAIQSLEDMEADLEMAILDTAVSLSALRDEITNIKYQVREAQITLEESKFEPPATQRKAEINLNKQQRALEQAVKSYELKYALALRDIATARQKVQDAQEYITTLQDFLAKFTITAPASGIVMYKEEFDGSKRKAGSSLNPFDLVVATLPDLTSMLSEVYVNEIEVNKVKVGQPVVITVDALPNKVLNGTVKTVANVGEVLPNSDVKMFEVVIKINGTDSEIRPEMTSWNKIITKTVPDAIYIPLECVRANSDDVPFVVTKHKTRQIVVLGDFNDKNVIIKEGLEPGNDIYIVPPEDYTEFKLVGQNLIAGNQ
ncbi:MAG TPA: efflux RND transporter periplasmic adaptor subunit [Bacteroidales bacterium]|nr:efflux RND transporter periplasmic adaptor subunit [Bacteroidales bacterium]